MDRLIDKVIIVTGGNGLLGKEIIKAIRLESAICFNFDINHDTNLDEFRVQCDITDIHSVICALKKIIYVFGRIDGLVNNAYPRSKDWGLKFEVIPFTSW